MLVNTRLLSAAREKRKRKRKWNQTGNEWKWTEVDPHRIHYKLQHMWRKSCGDCFVWHCSKHMDFVLKYLLSDFIMVILDHLIHQGVVSAGGSLLFSILYSRPCNRGINTSFICPPKSINIFAINSFNLVCVIGKWRFLCVPHELLAFTPKHRQVDPPPPSLPLPGNQNQFLLSLDIMWHLELFSGIVSLLCFLSILNLCPYSN